MSATFVGIFAFILLCIALGILMAICAPTAEPLAAVFFVVVLACMGGIAIGAMYAEAARTFDPPPLKRVILMV